MTFDHLNFVIFDEHDTGTGSHMGLEAAGGEGGVAHSFSKVSEIMLVSSGKGLLPSEGVEQKRIIASRWDGKVCHAKREALLYLPERMGTFSQDLTALSLLFRLGLRP